MQNVLNKFSLQKIDKLAPFIFFVLLLWLSWRVASLFWWFMAPPQIPTIQPVAMGSQQKVLPDIVRFSLFEERKTDPQAQQAANLPIKLEGVMLSNPRYLSSAMIRVDNKVSSYRVGAEIEGTNLSIAEVYWDRIVVRESGGQTREVLFGDNQPVQTASSPTSMISPIQDTPRAPETQTQAAIGNAIEQIQKDREQYLQQMGMNNAGGGFEISERTPPALRARLGLKPGDKVVSLNGQALGAGMNEAQLLEQMKKTGQAKIEIQRGEQTLTIQQNF